MKRWWVIAALWGVTCLGAARSAAPQWPQTACLQGTTINETDRTLDLRALEGTVRTLLREAGIDLSSPDCSTTVSIKIEATPVTQDVARLSASLGVNTPSGHGCERQLSTTVRTAQELQEEAQMLVKRLLASPPPCH
ncbi:hypothetical protein [Deinococcus navajonensis]|uniref:Uncharacterized protein n=1 Tax=Deinococcus navajonensis TaxID=309884 RepID=A0ABV8XKE7_9DEIO